MGTVWMIRAGQGSRLVGEFTRGYVGIGWGKLGDLTVVPTQDAIRSAYVEQFPDQSAGRKANAIAVIHKFRSVVAIGDTVITYDGGAREYLVGRVTSDYRFEEGAIEEYSHLRDVRWESRVDRDRLSAASKNSLGSTLTLFSVNEDVWSDIQSVLQGAGGTSTEPRIDEEREELEQIREDVVERAHEFIKDQIKALSDHELERLSAAILRSLGYRTRVSPRGPDRGVDVFASPDGLGLETPRIKVEVKHRPKTPMGAQEIRSFLGGLREGDRGLYVSSGGFTKEARYEAERATVPLTLLGLDDVASLIASHYEEFDLEGRALVPLVRVYWPAE